MHDLLNTHCKDETGEIPFDLIALEPQTQTFVKSSFCVYLPTEKDWSIARKIAAPKFITIPRKPDTSPSPTGYALSHDISINKALVALTVVLPAITEA